MKLEPLTLVDRVWGINTEEREIAFYVISVCFHGSDHTAAYRKNVWVVGNAQLRLTNSVVVTFVQVMQRETTWPASRDMINWRVQILQKRLQRLEANADGESYTIKGRGELEGPTGSASTLLPAMDDTSCLKSIEDGIADRSMR